MNLSELIALLRTSTTYENINNRRNEITILLPVISIMFDYDQNNSYHIYDLWEHSVRAVLEIPKSTEDDMLFLATLLHDIGKAIDQTQEGTHIELGVELARKYNPNYALAHYNLARSIAITGNKVEAAKLYQMALEINNYTREIDPTDIEEKIQDLFT